MVDFLEMLHNVLVIVLRLYWTTVHLGGIYEAEDHKLNTCKISLPQ